MLHGGETYQLNIRYDFSVNTNPLGMPDGVRDALSLCAEDCERYPDRLCTELTEALAKAERVPAEQLLIGNGASELLVLAALACAPKRVLLTAPSFLGYRHAAQAADAEILWHPLRREENFSLTERILSDLEGDIDLAILCTPANPVGNRIDAALLQRVIDTCEARGIRLIVDECFLCFTEAEAESVRKLAAAHKQLLVLDAFTKRHAIPGVRLGYAVCGDKDFLDDMRRRQPEWSVSSVAQRAGLAALQTPASYLSETRALLRKERGFLTKVLQDAHCRVFPGEANYIFFSSELPLFDRMLDAGILLRHCDNYEGLGADDYRMAIGTHEKNEVFAEALRKICKGI